GRVHHRQRCAEDRRRPGRPRVPRLGHRHLRPLLQHLHALTWPAGAPGSHPGGPMVASLASMKHNRSVPAATVIPVLIYPDVREAVGWLCAAFGFVERLRIGEDHRSQLRVGDGAVIVAEPGGHHRPPTREAVAQYVMVRVPDARSHCERARAHGAVILAEPADYMYGERQYGAEDFAGHRWTFTETLSDTDPQTWGGQYLNPA